jgi:hypothetical protein
MKRFFKAIGSGIVRVYKAVVKGIAKILGAGADAVTAAAPPLVMIKGDSSASHEAKAVAQKLFTEKTRAAVGVKVKVAASKGATIAMKVKWVKGAAVLTKIATGSSVAAGTAFLGGVLLVGFVGLIWLAKRLAKRWGGDGPWENVEKVEKGTSVIEMVEGLAA